MKDVHNIILSLGGPSAVARALKLTPQVVCNWSWRGAIPFERHTDVLKLADDLGVSLSRSRLEQIAKRRAA
jgi:hypothetical protein